MKKPITIDNYKNLTFSKIICEYYAGSGDEKNQYDILMPIDDELSELEVSTIYFNQLLGKFEGLKKEERIAFINYQINQYGSEAMDWLLELYEFLDEYDNDINAKRPKMADDFKIIIDQRLKKTKSRVSNLIWVSSDTDFVVLTKALLMNNSIKRIDGKKITQKEIDLTFERFLNVEYEYREDLVGSARKIKIESNNFLTKLRQAWQNYVDNKLK